MVTAFSILFNYYLDYNEEQRFKHVKMWLVENNLGIYAPLLHQNGITSLPKVAQMSPKQMENVLGVKATLQDGDGTSDGERLSASVKELNKKMRFRFWLYDNMLEGFQHLFLEYEIQSLEDIVLNGPELLADKRLKFAYYPLISVLNNKDTLHNYPVGGNTGWMESAFIFIWNWITSIAKFIIFSAISLSLVLVCWLVFMFFVLRHRYPNVRNWFARTRPSPLRHRTYTPTTRNNNNNNATPVYNNNFTNNLSWISRFFSRSDTTPGGFQTTDNQTPWYGRLFGNYFDPKKCVVRWDVAEGDGVVGNEAVLIVRFHCYNGGGYAAKMLDTLKVEVMINNTMIDNNVVYEDEDNTVSVHFTPIKSGMYSASILANGTHVGNQIQYRYKFKPGPVDAFKSSLVVPSSLMVFEQNNGELLTIDERDKFNNQCEVDFEQLHKYQFVIHHCKSGEQITPMITFSNEDTERQIKAYITITEAGVYTVDVLYDESILSRNIIFLVLSCNEMSEVNKNISTTHWNLWYEAYIQNCIPQSESIRDLNAEASSSSEASSSTTDGKRKKVFCYISPKLLIIKEYFLKVFPKKLYTFRINPAVKISLLNEEGTKFGYEGFLLEGTSGKSVKLFCQKRNVFVGTFVKLLLKNIGGSECFEDKKNYFYNELRNLNASKTSQKIPIKINRSNVVDDTWQAVKGIPKCDWWKNFEISFTNEMGLDYGGLSREWMQLLTNELFHQQLFRRFDVDNLQALIHPNPFREGRYKKLKYFELAGLLAGKCLVECSVSRARQQYIKARFTRSFLSQILGLGVSWRHFETDDKDYYSGKIKYIMDNDPDCLDVYFTEDVYNNNDQLVKTVELKSNGAKILVNETNKFEYIQKLADYRLVESVKEEVQAFLDGLHKLVPDGLLTIFDENELELLLCGMDVISVSDFKANHIKDYNNLFSGTVVGWFWTVVSGFCQEELSRLLQFTTGCSQLPPEGFSGLQPQFKISCSGAYDSLPMAHTCFNQLCLPSYSSMNKLRSQLLLAINEGSEGFGFS